MPKDSQAKLTSVGAKQVCPKPSNISMHAYASQTVLNDASFKMNPTPLLVNPEWTDLENKEADIAQEEEPHIQ